MSNRKCRKYIIHWKNFPILCYIFFLQFYISCMQVLNDALMRILVQAMKCGGGQSSMDIIVVRSVYSILPRA